MLRLFPPLTWRGGRRRHCGYKRKSSKIQLLSQSSVTSSKSSLLSDNFSNITKKLSKHSKFLKYIQKCSKILLLFFLLIYLLHIFFPSVHIWKPSVFSEGTPAILKNGLSSLNFSFNLFGPEFSSDSTGDGPKGKLSAKVINQNKPDDSDSLLPQQLNLTEKSSVENLQVILQFLKNHIKTKKTMYGFQSRICEYLSISARNGSNYLAPIMNRLKSEAAQIFQINNITPKRCDLKFFSDIIPFTSDILYNLKGFSNDDVNNQGLNFPYFFSVSIAPINDPQIIDLLMSTNNKKVISELIKSNDVKLILNIYYNSDNYQLTCSDGFCIPRSEIQLYKRSYNCLHNDDDISNSVLLNRIEPIPTDLNLSTNNGKVEFCNFLLENAKCPNSSSNELNNIYTTVFDSLLNYGRGSLTLPKQQWPPIAIDLLFNDEYSRAYFQNPDTNFRYSYNGNSYYSAALYSSTTLGHRGETDYHSYRKLKDTLFLNNCAVIHMDHAFLLPMIPNIDYLIDYAVDSLTSAISAKTTQSCIPDTDKNPASDSFHSNSQSNHFSSSTLPESPLEPSIMSSLNENLFDSQYSNISSNSQSSCNSSTINNSKLSNGNPSAPFIMPNFTLEMGQILLDNPQTHVPLRYFPKDLMPAFQLEYSRILSQIVNVYSSTITDLNCRDMQQLLIYQLLLLPKYYSDHINRTKKKSQSQPQSQSQSPVIQVNELNNKSTFINNDDFNSDLYQKRRIDSAIKRTTDLANLGNLSKAMSILVNLSDSTFPANLNNSDTRQNFIDLHPFQNSAFNLDNLPTNFIPQNSDSSFNFNISEDDVKIAFSKVKNGTANGFSPWTMELIKSVCKNDDCLRLTAEFLSLMANGHLDKKVWLNFRSIALRKPEKGIRPISICDVFVRLCGNIISTLVSSDISNLFQKESLQFGSCVKGGSDILNHTLQFIWDKNVTNDDNYSIEKLDIKNAFNCISRISILHGIRRFCPKLEAHFLWLYHDNPSLFDSSGKFICSASTGVIQGHPLAGLFFCLGIHGILLDAKDRFPLCIVKAYFDDIMISGPNEERSLCSQYVRDALFIECDLQINEKSDVYFNSDHGFMFTKIPHGSDIFIKHNTQQIFNKFIEATEYIRYLPSIVAFKLIKFCINSKPIYCLRNIHNALTEEASVNFDSSIDKLLLEKLNTSCEKFTEAQMIIRHLPRKLCGLGIRYANLVREPAYKASYENSLSHIRIYHPTLLSEPIIPSLTQSPGINFENNDNGDDLSYTSTPGPTPLYNSTGTACLTQKKLQELVDSSLYDKIINLLHDTPTLLKIFLSYNHPDCTIWMKSIYQIPSPYSKFQLNDNEFIKQTRLLLLFPTSPTTCSLYCPCGFRQSDLFPDNPLHALHCPSTRGLQKSRHDAVNSLLCKFIKKCDPTATVFDNEPKIIGDKTNVKTDLLVKRKSTFEYIDVSITEPTAPSFINQNAAENRSKAKMRKYSKAMSTPQLECLVPFIIEASGKIYSQTYEYINKVAHYVPGERNVHDKKLESLRKTFIKELNILIVKFNCRIFDLFSESLSTINPKTCV